MLISYAEIWNVKYICYKYLLRIKNNSTPKNRGQWQPRFDDQISVTVVEPAATWKRKCFLQISNPQINVNVLRLITSSQILREFSHVRIPRVLFSDLSLYMCKGHAYSISRRHDTPNNESHKKTIPRFHFDHHSPLSLDINSKLHIRTTHQNYTTPSHHIACNLKPSASVAIRLLHSKRCW